MPAALPSWDVIQHLLMHPHRGGSGAGMVLPTTPGTPCAAKDTTPGGICRNKGCSVCYSFKSLVKEGNLWVLLHNFRVIVSFLTQLNTFVKLGSSVVLLGSRADDKAEVRAAQFALITSVLELQRRKKCL